MNAGIIALVYYIWQSRNKSFWMNYVPVNSVIVDMIKQAIRSRIGVVLPKKLSRSDYTWLINL